MPIAVEFVARDGRLTATVTGEYEADAVVEEFGVALAHCRRDAIRSVLIDYRALQGRGYATQEILYATRIAELYRQYLDAGGHAIRFAYLGRPAFIRGWMPGVEQARAEGIEVLATIDEGEALRWLSAD